MPRVALLSISVQFRERDAQGAGQTKGRFRHSYDDRRRPQRPRSAAAEDRNSVAAMAQESWADTFVMVREQHDALFTVIGLTGGWLALTAARTHRIIRICERQAAGVS